MSKLSKLENAINSFPEEYREIWSAMSFLLVIGDMQALRHFTDGVRMMALALTSEDSVLKPLQDIHDLLSE